MFRREKKNLMSRAIATPPSRQRHCSYRFVQCSNDLAFNTLSCTARCFDAQRGCRYGIARGYDRASRGVRARMDGHQKIHTPDRLSELSSFGSNPGALRARTYIPESLAANAPLVVVLHGCTQTAASYDHGSAGRVLPIGRDLLCCFPSSSVPTTPISVSIGSCLGTAAAMAARLFRSGR